MFKDKTKNAFLALFLAAIIVLRVFDMPVRYAVIGAAAVGIAGLAIVLFVSPAKGKMVHCIAYCPIGTLIQYLRYVNPFRVRIHSECTECMLCTARCPYDALNKENILARKPGMTCTCCGDCLDACHGNFITYSFLKLSPGASRNLWIMVTVTIHAIFMGLARI